MVQNIPTHSSHESSMILHKIYLKNGPMKFSELFKWWTHELNVKLQWTKQWFVPHFDLQVFHYLKTVRNFFIINTKSFAFEHCLVRKFCVFFDYYKWLEDHNEFFSNKTIYRHNAFIVDYMLWKINIQISKMQKNYFYLKFQKRY